MICQECEIEMSESNGRFMCPCCWRQEGVQGPERNLVGDVAERIPRPDVVEEGLPGRRGVGKIVGAPELLRTIDWKLRKERRLYAAAARVGRPCKESFYTGKITALEELRNIVLNRAEERENKPLR